MKTDVQTPREIFFVPQHLVVPLFQRPYVWDEEEQWEPLWQDVRRLAELRLRDPASQATHFLGAVVVQAQDPLLGYIASSNIIDGQQRLTTLQLLMDAAGAVLEEAGLDTLAGQLEDLTHNQDNYVQQGESKLKIRHTNRDQAAFDEVMATDPPIDYSALQHVDSRIARCHAYFAGSVAGWLGEATDASFSDRANALVMVLTSGLQLVAINLQASENSQEIFETLNARGTPLTAADLIKNFVFQRLDAEGADAGRAYARDWPFDSRFWEAEVSAGRYRISRGSLFLNQWLISRTGEEVGPQQTFTRFKAYVEHESGKAMSELLPIIKKQADLYKGWTDAADDQDRQLNSVEMAVYRMKANEIELLKPLLIWLYAPERTLPQETIDQVVAAAESWIIRRLLLRLSISDLSRIVADIIRVHADASSDELVNRVTRHLARLNVVSTYWPGDDELRQYLSTEPVYRRYKRGRLRAVLEAVENQFRRGTNQPQVPRRGYPIEHILPQQWRDNWPVEGIEAETARQEHVHLLGNLTLLTSSLNSKVSNYPWVKKAAELHKHDTLLLNSRMLASAETTGWDEAAIDTRSGESIDTLLGIWPTPEGHKGEIVDPQSKAPAWVQLKHLLTAHLLAPGTTLTPRPGQWQSRNAVVRADGLLEIDGQMFDTPSGAGKFVKGGATNGWTFWRLPDGSELSTIRSAYTGEQPDDRS